MTPSDRLRECWAENLLDCEVFEDLEPTDPDLEKNLIEELRAAQESSLLHAKAVDEMRRDLKRRDREIEALKRRIAIQEDAIDRLLDRKAMNGA